MHLRTFFTATLVLLLTFVGTVQAASVQKSIDWGTFLTQHDMYWDHLSCDPVEPKRDFGQRSGYYAGALMGNGLLGVNFYKLSDDVYRLNVGRSDVTEIRQPYGTFNSARLPIGYFTLAPKGHVQKEEMRLSLYDAETRGTFVTDEGSLDFRTYVHADRNVIVFESECRGEDMDVAWDFVPQQAISPRCIINNDYPLGYVNSRRASNPAPTRLDEGAYHYLIQPLATDTLFTIGGAYVVGWHEGREGTSLRVLATVTRAGDVDTALQEARTLLQAEAQGTEKARTASHRAWWHRFYQQAAFLTFPDMKYESFYWAQYYKFACTARPGCPVVDLMGVWPNWDTPWPAIWMNLNIQLTYCWQTKANLGFLAQPLWDGLYTHRDNLIRNVTEIPGQETWTDAMAIPRTCTYDFHAPLDPNGAQYNVYEVGNLAWTLHYYWLQCNAYGDKQRMSRELFPMLKGSVNLFFHILERNEQGQYCLPCTASPEYTVGKPAGRTTNYDLANLRQGLLTLLQIDSLCQLHDPQAPQWKECLDNLVDFPYSEETGFKVSDELEFLETSHRHYSHLFMIYPYHMLDWNNPEHRRKMELSLNRWQGDQGYSRTGKAAMLASAGRGDEALDQMEIFMSRFLMPNTLYAESGPVIETPLAAMSSLHEFYMQDWGDRIRVFHGCPARWADASFSGMRAQGAFLVSATRRGGETVFVEVKSEKGGICTLQTPIPVSALKTRKSYTVVDDYTIRFTTRPGERVRLTNRGCPKQMPRPLPHASSECMPFGEHQ